MLQVTDAKNLKDLVVKFNELHPQTVKCHYDLIAENMKSGYSHKEIGTYYGWSAAMAALNGASELHLVDVSMKPFNTHEKYFEDHCKIYKYEMNSIDPRCAVECDTMLIDAVHRWNDVKNELSVHAAKVKDWIAFHDVWALRSGLSTIGPGLMEWLKTDETGKLFYLKEDLGVKGNSVLIKRK
tara:strand:+ start:6421 stop:6969 length:549 start_codon:yes stop_codon:yes gene_type:complete